MINEGHKTNLDTLLWMIQKLVQKPQTEPQAMWVNNINWWIHRRWRDNESSWSRQWKTIIKTNKKNIYYFLLELSNRVLLLMGYWRLSMIRLAFILCHETSSISRIIVVKRGNKYHKYTIFLDGPCCLYLEFHNPQKGSLKFSSVLSMQVLAVL